MISFNGIKCENVVTFSIRYTSNLIALGYVFYLFITETYTINIFKTLPNNTGIAHIQSYGLRHDYDTIFTYMYIHFLQNI